MKQAMCVANGKGSILREIKRKRNIYLFVLPAVYSFCCFITIPCIFCRLPFVISALRVLLALRLGLD